MAERSDPYRAFNFRIEVDDTTVAGFSEASGLTFDVDPVDYREGTDMGLHVRKLTGLRKFSNISLKRGFAKDVQLWKWYASVLNGVEDRRNGAIVLQDEEHKDVARWEFENGWICKWEGPTFNATGNDVAIESIEICVERVELT
ncbi:MAG: phage tail protein [Deltaproteobacteria bacterium]